MSKTLTKKIAALRMSDAGTERGAARQFGWNGALDEVLKLVEAEPDFLGLLRLNSELERLRAGIREHRDTKGDDRCWRDDEALYKLLPEGFTPPAIDSAVELERCRQFIASRQHPATLYISPERRIELLCAVIRDHACHSVDCREAQSGGAEACSCGFSEALAAAGGLAPA